jgi:DNA-binding transcriptional MerR regulator
MKDPERRTTASGAVGTPARPRQAAATGLHTIGEMAAELGVTTRTIRFYEAKGLIAPERKGVARSYSRRDRARLILILRGKNLGFSLEDIKEYLELYDADPTQTAQVTLLLAKVDALIASLQAKRADIDRTLHELKNIRHQSAEHLRRTPDTGKTE